MSVPMRMDVIITGSVVRLSLDRVGQRIELALIEKIARCVRKKEASVSER